jgi:two-component system, NarL family, sensor histidine kinase DesK
MDHLQPERGEGVSAWDCKSVEPVPDPAVTPGPEPVPGAPTGMNRGNPAPSRAGGIRRAGKAPHSRELAAVRIYPRPFRWFDFVWIIYSAFFFIDPIQRNTRAAWTQFAAAYAIFLALYAGIVYAGSRRAAYLCLAGMGLLGLVYFPLNAGASGMFIYVAAFAPFLTDSIAICILIFASSSMAMIAEGLLLHLSPWAWAFPAFVGLSVGSGNLIAAQQIKANQKLSLAHEEIDRLARVAERERIARDLHDVLGHTLSVVVLKSELAGKLVRQNPERAHKEIAEVEQIARTALAEVREAIQGYRSEGLAAELDRARATLEAAGITLDCASNPPKLLPALETVLSLILREAVTNIVRHAHASHCRISLERNGGRTALLVEDNGSGGIRREGSGLRGMRERVEALGGSFQILSESGTRLVIDMPAKV